MDRERVIAQLQALVERSFVREKLIFNIALGIHSERHELSWRGAAGIADPSTDTPMEEDTPFLIASVTKMFTAAAVMILQERGELALDDRVVDYLPRELIQGVHHYRGTDYTEQLTISHLLGQTSGLPDYFLERPKGGQSVLEGLLREGDRAWELEQVVRLTREKFPARFAPPTVDAAGYPTDKGVKALYSDTNYKLLGAVIETVCHETLQDVFDKLFFAPLAMSQSYLFGHAPAAVAQKPAQVYYKEQPLALDALLASHGPEGGIVSTLEGCLRFGRAFMTGDLFAREGTLAMMQRWHKIFFPLQYGYGLMRFKLPRLMAPFGYSPELIGHSGSSGSFLYYDKEVDVYLAGTINQMALRNTPFQLMIKAVQIVAKASR